MGRLPYDTNCDLVYGPNGLHPGQVYASGPCRVVYDSFQVPLLDPLSSRKAYVTLDFAEPNQALVTGLFPVLATDYSYADIIQILGAAVERWYVLFVERVTYRTHPSYFRAYVSESPLVNCPCPFDGAVFGPGFSQSVAGLATQVVTLPSPSIDTGPYWDASNPTRMTVPKTGKYRIDWYITAQHLAGAALAGLHIQYQVNGAGGTPTIWQFDNVPIASLGTSLPVAGSIVAQLNSGDYVEMIINNFTALAWSCNGGICFITSLGA